MKNLKIDDIHVTDSDNGKTPVVFVHAFPLNSDMWNEQSEYFRNDFRIITYDVRGLGKSAQNDNQFMMGKFADDFLKIAASLGLEKIHAAGLSMGGYIIQAAMLKKPELFKSVTFADTRLERDSNEGLASRANAIAMLKSGKRKEFLDGFTKNLVSKENFRNADLMKKIENIIEGNTDDGIAGAVLALATRAENTGAFKDYTLPVLVIVGEHDKLTPIDAAEKIKNEFRNSELHVIRNAGHMSNMENPKAFNEILGNFLKGNNE